MFHMLIILLLLPLIQICVEIYNKLPRECPKLYMQVVMFCVMFWYILTSDVVLGINQLHKTNPLID